MSGNEPILWRNSLRTKLVLASIVVEMVMLVILLGNSLRLVNAAVEEQTKTRIDDVSPLLNAALGSSVFERDHVTIMEILGQLLNSSTGGFRYIVVYDEQGQVYAKGGTVDTSRLPALDEDMLASLNDGVYDTVTPLTLSNLRIGEVRFGLSLASFLKSRDSILTQGLVVAASEILLTFLLLSFAAYVLTRHINNLAAATQRISAGDYDERVNIHVKDEIGLLAENFNRMGETIADRVEALRDSEQALFAEKERAEVTLHSIGDAVITTDVNAIIDYLNPVAEVLTGWPNVEAIGRPLEQVFQISDEIQRGRIENPVHRCLREQTVVKLQNHTLLTNRNGDSFPIEDSAAPIRNRDGNVIGAVLVFHDVSTTRLMTRQLKYQATHDSLTGLLNRDEFEHRLSTSLEEARVDDSQHALCYLDLDQFKVVNDTCGHMAGDELLRQLGNLMKIRIRDSDVLARLGGDEFGLLIMNCPDDRARSIIEDIRDAIRDFHFVWEKQTFQIGVSIGVVWVRSDSGSISEILSAADVTCYLAKEQGRNRIRFFQIDDVEHLRRRGEMQWSSRIAAAIRDGRFVLYYQKIVPLNAGVMPEIDCELLVRMLDDEGNTIMPGVFIPAAERYHHMADIDRWVIHAALHAPEIIGNSATINGFSINISGQSICAEDFLSYVVAQINSSGIEPQRICFEITETTAITNLSRAMKVIAQLREKGCLFALDDFGSGLSSFAYLKNLPVDFLKIDGAFVRDIVEDRADRAMVEAINQVGQAMGIRTIAEFIENAEIKKLLEQMGVDYGQGYGIHQPVQLSTLNGSISV